jgi:hypothetical protein
MKMRSLPRQLHRLYSTQTDEPLAVVVDFDQRAMQ